MPKYVSLIGNDLVQPLADLLDRLLSLPRPTEGQSAHGDERGYSISICLLAAVVVESFVMRARYLHETEEAAKERSLHKFLAMEYPDFELSTELIEVFILRDVIAHNHLWMIESSSDRNVWIDILSKQMHVLTASVKDKKYSDYVDMEIARTVNLCLHVIPTQIQRTDVSKVLRTVKKTLDFLAQREGPILGVEATLATFIDRQLSLQSILDESIKAI